MVPDKAERVASFHRETLKALAEIVGAAGLDHPQGLKPVHFMHRAAPDRVVSFAELYPGLRVGELLTGTKHPKFRAAWEMASPESFQPVG